jgi:hypothetical protein
MDEGNIIEVRVQKWQLIKTGRERGRERKKIKKEEEAKEKEEEEK